MPAKPSLEMLLEFAQKERDVSAKKLGQHTLQHQQATEKLNILLEYRQSYQTRFHDAAKNGIDHMEWLNFITFIEKLDAAITEQRKNVTIAQGHKEAVNNEFQISRRKLNSYNTLSKRHQRIEIQQQIKHEQKELDESTSNNNIRKNLK